MTLVQGERKCAGVQSRQAFISPAIDFLCLGGGALVISPLLLWGTPDDFTPRVLGLGLLMSTAINHPHFAHSYQIFYRTFHRVLRDPAMGLALRGRYLWAGLLAPLALLAFFVLNFQWGNAQTLGYAGNAMSFLVGWHYVKQGYGVLMVSAALRCSFFRESDKRVLLFNAFGCWIVSWLAANKAISQRDLWGLSYATIDVPVALLWVGAAAVAISTFFTAWVLTRYVLQHRSDAPLNGILAYVAALYPWVFLIREPVLVFFIPAMHALQYLAIVWRYQLNVETMKPDGGGSVTIMGRKAALPNAKLRFARFVATGMLLGIIGFSLVPMALEALLPYDHVEYGDTLYIFVLFVFINIHHYFIDNAMWRKENPHVLPFLLARSSRPLRMPNESTVE